MTAPFAAVIASTYALSSPETSPSRGARPPGMKTSAKPGLSWNTRVERSQSPAITGESGKPSSA